MKTAIVYYSYTGMTKKYVEKIKEKFDCELIEIKPKQDIKVKGYASYFVGGLKIAKKDTPELMDYSFNKDDYDLIILASPVWAYTFVPAMRTFLESEKIRGKKLALLMTHRGGPGKALDKFGAALEGNEFAQGLELNAKESEGDNMLKLDKWMSEVFNKGL